MQKIIISIFLLLALTSCFGDSSEVKKAKQDLGIVDVTSDFNITWDSKIEEKDSTLNNWIELSNDPRISIKQISWEKVLELDELNYKDFKKWHAKITWKTTSYVSKIKVDFSNENSNYPNDEYTLAKFKPGWKNFEYNANSKYKVLDFGLNKYIFTAYTKTWESVLELKVLVSINDDEYLDGKKTDNQQGDFSPLKETSVDKLIWSEDDIVYTELPEWWDFGNVVKLWEKSFTYSDIKWLEIKKDILEKINCDKNEDTDTYFVTEFLWKRQKSWYYWNTCRDILKNNWISFYVTRLDWEDYFYEKHYLDFKHWFYWIYEIEKGQWVDKDNISEKNKELKELNKTFSQVEIVDNLFKKIIK